MHVRDMYEVEENRIERWGESVKDRQTDWLREWIVRVCVYLRERKRNGEEEFNLGGSVS